MAPTPDPKAAAIHRRRANESYDAAERFRKLGLESAMRAARAAARHEDEIAEILEHPERHVADRPLALASIDQEGKRTDAPEPADLEDEIVAAEGRVLDLQNRNAVLASTDRITDAEREELRSAYEHRDALMLERDRDLEAARLEGNGAAIGRLLELPIDRDAGRARRIEVVRPRFRDHAEEISYHRSIELLKLASEPIDGRPGWRRDANGREWYSSEWL